MRRVKSWGSKILSSATTVDEARYLEAHGVDAVIAQGYEAGGHRGMFLSDELSTQVGTLPLVRQVVQAVTIPVIAAGGIADAQGVAAAIALGAAGVQVGTAYLFCPEATTNPLHRAALKSDVARTTAVTNVFTGRPARGIVNRLMREIGPINGVAPAFPLAATAVFALRTKAERLGVNDFTAMWAGQSAALCREMPAAELTRTLAAGAPHIRPAA
jgi:nitronate monooxygenase